VTTSAARRMRPSSRPTQEVWVTVPGENYISSDAKSFARRPDHDANGPGMQIFSPDGKYGYICFTSDDL